MAAGCRSSWGARVSGISWLTWTLCAERWRRGRKLMHQLTMEKMAKSYQPSQNIESKRMLYDLIRDPSRYELWFERYAGGLIFRIGYGKTIVTGEEAHVRKALHVVHSVERIASPGSYLVDTIPILQYLPEWMAPFKKEGRQLHEAELKFFRTLINDVRAEREAKVTAPSFTNTWLEEQDAYGLTEDEAAYVIGTLFEAGSGTTASAMMSFMLAMTLYPKWQEVITASHLTFRSRTCRNLTILSGCGRRLTACVGIECQSLTTYPIYRYAVLSSKRFSVGDQLQPEVSALQRSLEHPATSFERELTERG